MCPAEFENSYQPWEQAHTHLSHHHAPQTDTVGDHERFRWMMAEWVNEWIFRRHVTGFYENKKQKGSPLIHQWQWSREWEVRGSQEPHALHIVSRVKHIEDTGVWCNNTHEWRGTSCPLNTIGPLKCESVSRSVMSDFVIHGLQPATFLCARNLQARILEWVAISFSRGSSWPRDRTQVSCITGRFFTIWAIWETQLVPYHWHDRNSSLSWKDPVVLTSVL